MTKRIITLVLALAMLATACAFAVAEDYKWSGTISVAQYAFGPIDDDQITALVEERLREYGYDVKFDIVYLENSQYETLLNLRLANQEAPDIFRVNGGTMVDQYYQQGVLKSWTEEFFRENAPDVAAFIDAGNPLQTNTNIVDATWAMAKRDGKMVCLPLISINQGALLNVIYNTQWLEKLGREVPETLDDFVDLMYAFTNDDPDGNGENDTYGMSTTMLNIIFGAYGSWTGFMHMDTGFWYNVDGEIVSCDVMPGNKDALALLHQMYVDGVIDPEFVTGENQGGYWAISHSFVNGRIGVSHGARMTHYTPANLYGTGIRKIMDAYEGARVQPRIETSSNAFKLILPNRNAAPEESTVKSEPARTANEEAIRKYLLNHDSITRKETQALLKTGQSAAGRILKEMVENGWLARIGNGRSTGYELRQ